jgi:hypothetical protein
MEHIQVSRLKQPPPAVGELIRIANLVVPAEYQMPDLLSELASQDLLGGAAVKAFRWSIDTHFPADEYSDLRDFLGPIQRLTFADAVHRYSFVRLSREILSRVAAAAGQPGPLEFPPLGLEGIGTLEIDSGGRLRFVMGSLQQILEGVEAARIRHCPICGALYWAGRMDRPACGRRCGHVLRSRKWRKAYNDTYKLQRYRKSESANSGMRSKSNGKRGEK